MSLGLYKPKQKTGRPVRLSADGYPERGSIGYTVAWSAITAAGSDTELADGTPVFVGEKAIRYGTVMVPIRRGVRVTATISGGPTGGNLTFSVTKGTDTQTTANIAYNATAAAVQSALEALSNVGVGKVWVSKVGAVFTLTFDSSLGVVTVAKNAAGLTGGTSPDVTLAVVYAAVSAEAGKYGPFDSSADDGRQFLVRNNAFLVDYTIKNAETTVLGSNLDNEHIGGIVGGWVWKQRLLVGNSTQPTLQQVLDAFPRLTLTPDE